jgi:hypothetical protein
MSPHRFQRGLKGSLAFSGQVLRKCYPTENKLPRSFFLFG